MDTCILHIGAEKTGSTSIQNNLSENSSHIINFHYSRYLGSSNHYLLPFLFYESIHQNTDILSLENITNAERFLERKNEIIEALKYERAIHPGSWILSSEHLSSRLHKFSQLRVLKQLLENVGFSKIKVILYIRNYWSYIQSLYKTYIRDGGKANFENFILSEYILMNANYYFIYNLWSSVFDNVSCFKYDRNTDIFNHFIEVNDIKFSKNINAHRYNVSNDFDFKISTSDYADLRKLAQFLFENSENSLGTLLFNDPHFFKELSN